MIVMMVTTGEVCTCMDVAAGTCTCTLPLAVSGGNCYVSTTPDTCFMKRETRWVGWTVLLNHVSGLWARDRPFEVFLWVACAMCW